jgi:hypothetical protein
VKAELESERSSFSITGTNGSREILTGFPTSCARFSGYFPRATARKAPRNPSGLTFDSYMISQGIRQKGSLSDGGLCAGAIFRTQRFIETKNRSGSKAGQSVHIEHTFPIRQLKLEITKRRFRDYVETLAWLLEHSVTTAFHEDEKEHLIGRSSTSDALNPLSRDYLRPFARYEKLHSSAGIVWNVLDAEELDPKTFPFQQHFDLVLRLLHESGASKSMLSRIRGVA